MPINDLFITTVFLVNFYNKGNEICTITIILILSVMRGIKHTDKHKQIHTQLNEGGPIRFT